VKFLMPLFFILLSTSAAAVDFPIEISEYIDDVKVDAYIAKSDITEDSKWQPFTSRPPLSVEDSLKAVKKYLKSHTQLLHSTLLVIELRQIPHHESYWHYLVKIRSNIDNKLQTHFFVVLMSGKVIPAFKEPNSFK